MRSECGCRTAGKVLPLDEAVRRHVRPGMALHLAGGIGGPSAAISELLRQYHSQDPRFTLIQSTVTGHGPSLIHCGLVAKLVFAGCMEVSDSTRPSGVFQKAYRKKTLEAENWSLLSLQQRLMAGAMGVPFLPTRSLAGSRLAFELRGDFLELADPFGGDQKVGVVRALTPDLSIVHGCVADEDGNTILGAPVGDDVWGALASRGGVLVTVEDIVPADVIRQHASLVKIPAYAVRAVSKAPLGVHPFSFANPGVPGVSSYEMDRAFLVELSKVTREGRLDAWLEEWVFGCPSHEHLLAKLGAERTSTLRRGREPARAGRGPAPAADGSGYSAEEAVLVAVAREVAASVRRFGHKTILVGAGGRAVAPWLAYFQLRDEGLEVELLTGNGQVGYTPLPGEAFLQTTAGIASSKMLTDTVTTHAVVVGGANSACLAVLGAAQVDRRGNLNSTKLSEDRFLVGSGGGNDSVNAREVIVVLDQSPERFVAEVPYVTSIGERVTTVVSQFGVFRKREGADELRLAALLPDPRLGRAERLRRVREACGWPLEVEVEAEELAPPTPEELGTLRWLAAEDSVHNQRSGG